MSAVRRIEAPRAVFMKVEDMLYIPDHGGEPQKHGEAVETYFHTHEGDWRVFTKNFDIEPKRRNRRPGGAPQLILVENIRSN